MALIPSGLSVIVALAEGLISPILFTQRSIGGFVADVTVEEDHVDELAITDFPVEQGATITDNSYKLPAQLRVTVGYSNSSTASLGDPNYVNSVYSAFLEMQASRQPIDVFTGRRVYQNMLIRRLHMVENKDWASAMLLDCEMREILIATTQTITVPPASQMRDPGTTGATVPSGQKNLLPGSGYDGPQALADGITPP